jgi:hypothetical protein
MGEAIAWPIDGGGQRNRPIRISCVLRQLLEQDLLFDTVLMLGNKARDVKSARGSSGVRNIE